METIRVNKADLLAKLQTNRNEHRSLFLKAQEAYRAKWIEELERRLEEARNHDPINRAFSLPVPEDHTDDFDTAIEMLDWELGDDVELAHHEFLQYVKNEWGWQRSFHANTTSYVAP